MEYRECKCPACGETMQVPEGRMRIICMFCGQEMAVNSKDGDVPDFDSSHLLESIPQNVDILFDGQKRYMELFRKKTYDEAFVDFQKEYHLFIDSLYSAALYAKALNASADLSVEKDAGYDFLDSIGEIFAEHASKLILIHPKKKDNHVANEDANMYMVSYFLPALLENKGDAIEDLTEALCDAWSDHFPLGNISAGGYETISKGFKKGIFGLLKGRF